MLEKDVHLRFVVSGRVGCILLATGEVSVARTTAHLITLLSLKDEEFIHSFIRFLVLDQRVVGSSVKRTT